MMEIKNVSQYKPLILPKQLSTANSCSSKFPPKRIFSCAEESAQRHRSNVSLKQEADQDIEHEKATLRK
jgi:hypothetical protein